MSQARQADPREFAAAWAELPEAFRQAHRPPAQRDGDEVARWLNEIHKATEGACVAGLALATEHACAAENRAAAEVLHDVRPFRRVMRALDDLAKARR